MVADCNDSFESCHCKCSTGSLRPGCKIWQLLCTVGFGDCRLVTHNDGRFWWHWLLNSQLWWLLITVREWWWWLITVTRWLCCGEIKTIMKCESNLRDASQWICHKVLLSGYLTRCFSVDMSQDAFQWISHKILATGIGYLGYKYLLRLSYKEKEVTEKLFQWKWKIGEMKKKTSIAGLDI